MKNIKIKVVGSQSRYSKKEEKIELLTDASFDKKDDCYIIIYDESDLTGMEGSKTKLKAEKDKLIMTKFGTVSSNIEFIVGKRYNTGYLTSLGLIDMEILTTKYETLITDEGVGNIDIEYKVNLSGFEESLNKLHIELKG